ncbi:hypothetical protein ACHAW5_008480 [Stephanodiscus triporus]|uniref:Uncharacterized protein n=1 Tax=Stephanodiscus triporus TaxID=2934178 RepID=A0ABD3MPG5_9STRA
MQPQAPANATIGYKGKMACTKPLIKNTFWSRGMCPVNVHWHKRAEHLSMGQYDEKDTGPAYEGSNTTGYRCNLYKGGDERFTKKYNWKHCKNMEVAETYKVHWLTVALSTSNRLPFHMASLAVAGLMWTILWRIILGCKDRIWAWARNLTFYTGSATSDKVNNAVCSEVTPITWQVDRKCHLISASSFDKLCYNMKMQHDDMTADIKPDGSRVLVLDAYATSNQDFVGVYTSGSTIVDLHLEEFVSINEKSTRFE